MLSTSRMIGITNGYMLAVGASAHRYSSVFGTFRLSIVGIIILILVNSLYFVALWFHYDRQQQIHIIRLLSELLHDCIYLHLLIGAINWLVVLLQYRSLLAFAAQVSENVAEIQKIGQGGTILEWFIYYRMWSNPLVLLILTVYNLYFIDLCSLTGTKIMLIIGLAYPHLLIADILRYVTIQALLINAMWTESNRQLKESEQPPNGVTCNSTPIFK